MINSFHLFSIYVPIRCTLKFLVVARVCFQDSGQLYIPTSEYAFKTLDSYTYQLQSMLSRLWTAIHTNFRVCFQDSGQLYIPTSEYMLSRLWTAIHTNFTNSSYRTSDWFVPSVLNFKFFKVVPGKTNWIRNWTRVAQSPNTHVFSSRFNYILTVLNICILHGLEK